MNVYPLHTNPIHANQQTLLEVLDAHLEAMPEGAVLAITSKIVALCEGRVVKMEEVDKQALVKQESQYFLPSSESKYAVMMTIAEDLLAPSAGIDESNSDGYYVLWPQDAYATANAVRAYLRKRFSINRVGVLITDSRTTPLRWGTIGVSLAYSGFQPLHNYIGSPDIFGREMKMTKTNIQDALAVAAVLVMGEGAEQTPLAIIEDIPFVEFVDRDATPQEIADLRIGLADDLYSKLLTSVPWEKGDKSDTVQP